MTRCYDSSRRQGKDGRGAQDLAVSIDALSSLDRSIAPGSRRPGEDTSRFVMPW